MFLRPIIPKEHGAWAVLLVPLLIGAQLGGGIDWFVLFFSLSSLGVFLSYVPAQTLLRSALGRRVDGERLITSRQWTLVYLAAAVVFILPVLLVRGRWLLLPIGALGMGCFFLNFILTRVQAKTILGDLAAVLGLTLTGPSAYYVVSDRLDTTALIVWLLDVLFFGSCVFYVHMRIQARAAKKTDWVFRDRVAYGGLNLIYHLAMIVGLVALVFERLTPSLVLLAFVPITINALWGTMRLVSETNFKRLGFTLLTHSIAFMVLLLILLR